MIPKQPVCSLQLTTAAGNCNFKTKRFLYSKGHNTKSAVTVVSFFRFQLPVKIIFAIIFSALLGTATAADPNASHPHQGIIAKFIDPAPALLSPGEQETLVSGKPVYQQTRHNDIDRGTAIFDVIASRETVWEVITSFQDYPEWIKEMSATEIYLSEGRNILVDFTLSVYMVDVQYYIKHDYQPEKGSMTWTLDYRRKSDLDDSAGYWLVYPSPVDTAKTRVEYSVDLRIGPTIPSFIETILADKGIKNATKWVKKNAEKLGD